MNSVKPGHSIWALQLLSPKLPVPLKIQLRKTGKGKERNEGREKKKEGRKRKENFRMG